MLKTDQFQNLFKNIGNTKKSALSKLNYFVPVVKLIFFRLKNKFKSDHEKVHKLCETYKNWTVSQAAVSCENII